MHANFRQNRLNKAVNCERWVNQPANAAEGAWSNYTPGTYGDFSINYAPPGFYIRNYVLYNSSELKDFPYALSEQPVKADLKQKLWIDYLNMSYVSKFRFLGAHYFNNLAIPYAFSAKVDFNASGISLHGSKSGLGDIQIIPVGLMWNLGDFHFTLSENFVLPTGEYDKNALVSIGRNYYSCETLFGTTWLDEKGGHEVSFIAGYMVNLKNHATDYRTGNELHLDYAFNQYFSKRFAVGVVGYYYKQITDDSNPTLSQLNALYNAYGDPAPGGFKSESAAVGPSIMYGLTDNIQIFAKWLYEYHAENRFKGNWVIVSAAVNF